MENPLSKPLAWDLVADGYLAEVVPMFRFYADAALRLVDPSPQARVLDIACGPGTLALMAAAKVAQVDALDFSPEMIERLRRAAPANVHPRLGDAQALPYDDASFDAAFSMFGLIFAPDRAKALTEAHRVLRPGARLALSSWPPSERAPLMHVLFQALRDQNLGLPEGKPSLGEPEDYAAELGAAGFRDVRVEPVVMSPTAPSAAALWGSLERSMAPLVLMRRMLGEERFGALATAIQGRIRDRFGEGEIRFEMPAWIGVGTA